MGRQTRRLSATRPAISICKTYLIGCQLHKAVSLMDFSGMLQACRDKLLMFQSRATDVCTHTLCTHPVPSTIAAIPPPPEPTHPTTHPPPSSYFSSVYMCRLIKYIYTHTYIYVYMYTYICIYIYTHMVSTCTYTTFVPIHTYISIPIPAFPPIPTQTYPPIPHTCLSALATYTIPPRV